MGIQFVKQYAQSGLREKIPLYSAFTVDEATLPAIGDAADGNYEVGFWSPDLDNPRNKEFVAAFRDKYHYYPAFYGAQSFDAITMIDRAVAAVKGDLANKRGLIAALAKADFPPLRGPFKYNTNYFPIENFYLLRAELKRTGLCFGILARDVSLRGRRCRRRGVRKLGLACRWPMIFGTHATACGRSRCASSRQLNSGPHSARSIR